MRFTIKAYLLSLFLFMIFVQLHAQEDTVTIDFPYYGEEFEKDYNEEDYYEDYYEDEYVEEQKEFSGFMPGIDFRWTRPVSVTRNRLKESIFGVSLELLYQFSKTKPLFAGLNFHWGQYDREFLEYTEYIEIDYYLMRETSYLQQLNFDLTVRYFPGIEIGFLQPYFDVGAGPRYSYAYTQVNNVDLDENVAFHYEGGDWELGYNFAIGTLINFMNFDENFYGSFSISYSGGPNTEFYLRKDYISYNEIPIERFNKRSIPVNFLRFNFGFRGYL